MARKKQRVTIADVAQEAGVSAMTVSRVINQTGRISQATRQQVLAVIARLNYRPSRAARALVTHNTLMIGVIVQDITNPFFSAIVQGIETVAWEKHYSVLLANTNETRAREEAVLNYLDESTVDGLIVCSSRLPDDVLLALIKKQRAVTLINRHAPDSIANVVFKAIGYKGRARIALQHLMRSGHHNIGHLCLKFSAMQIGRDEYMAILRAGGITPHPGWYRTCEPTWAAGYALGRTLITEHPELDAVIAGNDLVALGLMRAVHEAGLRVPEDLAIVGGDDTLLASQVTPALTTFHVPTYEIGMIAARMLFGQLEGDTEYHEYLYPETLVIRESAP